MSQPVATPARLIETIEGRLLFGRPTRIRPAPGGPHPDAHRTQAHRLRLADGAVLEGWSATPLIGPIEGAVLYFGGRNENVAWVPGMASFNPRLAIHAFNYRGFGESAGRASERRAKADARALVDFIAASAPDAPLTIMGRSLGTAVALWQAVESRPSRLVLMSPFESVPDVLRARPLGRLVAGIVRQRFACTELAAAHAGATLVLLAERDTTVPHAQSLRLCARLPVPATIHVVPGTTHKTLPRAVAAQRLIRQFLDDALASASYGRNS